MERATGHELAQNARRGELPELTEIKDTALRDKVVEAWALGHC